MPQASSSSHRRRVTIVGGGFSGVCAAIHLVRATPVPLDITLIESRDRIGPGLAYSGTDPDHRLNGPTWSHSIDPLDAGHFSRWCERHGVFKADPEGQRPDGSAFARRSVYGDYLEDTLRQHAVWAPTQSTIHSVHDVAVSAQRRDGRYTVQTQSGLALTCELLIIATGNALPKLQAPLAADLAQHPGVIENPLDTQRLRDLAPTARVLLIGSGLTALDVLSTLQRRGHAGEITVLSRRGLRPKPQAPAPDGVWVPATGTDLLNRLNAPAPDYLTDPRLPRTVRAWTRAVRARIREAGPDQTAWYPVFDAVRDAVWRLWPQLPAAQKRRYLRRLRTWYDVHRFRAPPQNEVIVAQALAQGHVRHVAARLLAAHVDEDGRCLHVTYVGRNGQIHEQQVDALVNCTGLDAASRAASNPFLANLLQQGLLTPDDVGIGFAVDSTCRVIHAHHEAEEADPALRLIGPPTAGTFGDPIGALFIAAQIHRILPDLLHTLAASAPLPAPALEATA